MPSDDLSMFSLVGFSLAPFTHLESLAIDLEFCITWSDVARALEVITTPGLRALTLRLVYTRDASAARRMRSPSPVQLFNGVCVEDDGLEELDAVLSGELFHRLNVCKVTCKVTQAQEPQVPDITASICQRLPRLHARGVLEVNYHHMVRSVPSRLLVVCLTSCEQDRPHLGVFVTSRPRNRQSVYGLILFAGTYRSCVCLDSFLTPIQLEVHLHPLQNSNHFSDGTTMLRDAHRPFGS